MCPVLGRLIRRGRFGKGVMSNQNFGVNRAMADGRGRYTQLDEVFAHLTEKN